MNSVILFFFHLHVFFVTFDIFKKIIWNEWKIYICIIKKKEKKKKDERRNH
jgi:hypothetical protein